MSHHLRAVHVRRPLSGPVGFMFATTMALLALGVAFAASRYLTLGNLSLILLLAVLIVAARTGMVIAVYTAVLCFLGYNFFFTQPYYTLMIDRADDLVTVLMFLAVALVCSRLATQLSSQVQALRLAQQRATALLQLGQQLAGSPDTMSIRQVGAQALSTAVDACVIVLERDAGRSLHSVHSIPSGLSLSTNEVAAASWNSGPGENGLLAVGDTRDFWIVPMTLGMHDHGAVALRMNPGHRGDNASRRELALAMCQDLALALERVRLSDALEDNRVKAETARLRSTLLASVSHDLRSPLATIIGSASTLGAYGSQLAAEDRRELIAGIEHEGERLDRYIQNLLDMTRLGEGMLDLQRDWVDAGDLVLAAVTRARRCAPGQTIDVALPPETPLLHVQPALIEQALFNILENALHFSPPEFPVQLRLAYDPERVQIEVVDRGPGVPEAEREKIFDMFYSVSRGDRGRHGTGLGLAICRGMVEAHGGQVVALPGENGGTMVRITLPLAPLPAESAP